MWIIEAYENDKILQKLFLKGPKVVIGRAESSDLPFPNDKSISRKHVEVFLNILHGKSIISIIDLGSKFGTFINERKLEPNLMHELLPDQINHVKLGVMETHLRMYSEKLSFCVSRLEKSEREKVKYYARAIEAEIVKSVDLATHLITSSSWTATAKSLFAIVLQKPIVSMSWLRFIDETRPVVPIPKIEDHFPIADKIVDYRLKESRSSLCKDFLVLLTDESTDQYSGILRECGAMVLPVWTYSSKSDWKKLTSLITDNLKLNRRSKVCFFIDEMKSVPENFIGFAKSTKSEIFWLTDGALAFSVLSLSSPPLSTDVPNVAETMAVVESMVVEDQPPTQTKDFSVSFADSMTAQSAVIEERDSIVSETPAKRSKQQESDDDEILLRATKRAKKNIGSQKIIETDTPFSQVNSSFDVDNIGLSGQKNIKQEQRKDEVMEESITGKTVGKGRGPRGKKIEEEQDNDEEILERGKRNTKPRTTKSATKTLVTNENVNQVFDFFFFEEEEEEEKLNTMPALGKRKRVGEEPQQNADVSATKETKNLPAPASSTQTLITKEKAEDSEPVRRFILADDWVDVNRGMNGLKILEGDDQALEEERNLIMPASVQQQHGFGERDGYSRKRGEIDGPCKDVRKFVKNFVRTVHPANLIKSKQMEKVLPKESEREVQLRLEYEAELARQKIADSLLNDNIEKVGGKSKRRN